MAKINIVVPRLNVDKFSGGIWCIFQYAHGLKKRGHEVNVVPVVPSPYPQWFPFDFGQLRTIPRKTFVRMVIVGILQTFLALVKWRSKNYKAELQRSWRKIIDGVTLIEPRILVGDQKIAAGLFHLRDLIPDADITLATGFESALPVALYGKGRLFYFMQHYEPFFKNEFADPDIAEKEATLSYKLGLKMIANSSWLKGEIESRIKGTDVALCPNAIDRTVFSGAPKIARASDEIVVISYGGREAEWKGFKEMAQAMALVRNKLPRMNVRWLVYGSALLPPQNPIASYEFLGFLRPSELANAYRNADILLSASWYESFPLFPLEAMACGLPVITTQSGTEEFAHHGKTAEIVEPKRVDSIASGLERLITDLSYRTRLAADGNSMSEKFSWNNSVITMEKILLGL